MNNLNRSSLSFKLLFPSPGPMLYRRRCAIQDKQGWPGEPRNLNNSLCGRVQDLLQAFPNTLTLYYFAYFGYNRAMCKTSPWLQNKSSAVAWAWPGLVRQKRNFCFEVNGRFSTSWIVALYTFYFVGTPTMTQSTSLMIRGGAYADVSPIPPTLIPHDKKKLAESPATWIVRVSTHRKCKLYATEAKNIEGQNYLT